MATLLGSVQTVAELSSESLFKLKNDAADLLAAAKAIVEHVDRALDLRYAQRAHQLRLAAGKDTGVVHFDDGQVRITAVAVFFCGLSDALRSCWARAERCEASGRLRSTIGPGRVRVAVIAVRPSILRAISFWWRQGRGLGTQRHA